MAILLTFTLAIAVVASHCQAAPLSDPTFGRIPQKNANHQTQFSVNWPGLRVNGQKNNFKFVNPPVSFIVPFQPQRWNQQMKHLIRTRSSQQPLCVPCSDNQKFNFSNLYPLTFNTNNNNRPTFANTSSMFYWWTKPKMTQVCCPSSNPLPQTTAKPTTTTTIAPAPAKTRIGPNSLICLPCNAQSSESPGVPLFPFDPLFNIWREFCCPTTTLIPPSTNDSTTSTTTSSTTSTSTKKPLVMCKASQGDEEDLRCFDFGVRQLTTFPTTDSSPILENTDASVITTTFDPVTTPSPFEMTIDSITTTDPLMDDGLIFITASSDCEIIIQDGVPVEVCDLTTTPSFQSTTEPDFSTEDNTETFFITT